MRVVTTCEPYSRRGNLIQLAPAPQSHRSKDKEESLTLDERAVCASVGAERMLANCPKNATGLRALRFQAEVGMWRLSLRREETSAARGSPYTLLTDNQGVGSHREEGQL